VTVFVNVPKRSPGEKLREIPHVAALTGGAQLNNAKTNQSQGHYPLQVFHKFSSLNRSVNVTRKGAPSNYALFQILTAYRHGVGQDPRNPTSTGKQLHYKVKKRGASIAI
jgi:hypothetical protein